ncbi:MAG: lmo0937 family membrane protein [Candidatus Shapirobacteria bacterium]
MLNIIIILLVISWIGGFSLHIGGGLIHLLLVIAVIVLIVRLLGL